MPMKTDAATATDAFRTTSGPDIGDSPPGGRPRRMLAMPKRRQAGDSLEPPRSRIEQIRDQIRKMREESEEELTPREIADRLFDETHTNNSTTD